MNQSNQADRMSIEELVSVLQTIFSISSSSISRIGERARTLGVFWEKKTYKEWVECLQIKFANSCPRCKLPTHLGQCLPTKGDEDGAQ